MDNQTELPYINIYVFCQNALQRAIQNPGETLLKDNSQKG